MQAVAEWTNRWKMSLSAFQIKVKRERMTRHPQAQSREATPPAVLDATDPEHTCLPGHLASGLPEGAPYYHFSLRKLEIIISLAFLCVLFLVQDPSQMPFATRLSHLLKLPLRNHHSFL